MLVRQSFIMRRYNVILVMLATTTVSAVDHFNESLTIKPLVSGHVSAQFDFIINAEKVAGPHYELVPRQLGEVLSTHSVRELHLSLTQGFWRHSVWGYPAREAGTGARLWVWFHSNTSDVDAAWSSLVSALSGLFCASLNFMDGTVTASPELAYRPAGVVRDAGELDSRLLRVASLPREATCTENLTPWQKLLPCAAKAGLSTLLNPLHLYSSSYHSLSVDFRPICESEPCLQPSQELAFSVAVVHDPAASGQQRRSDPTQHWSMKSLFGAGLFGACALAQHSNVYVDLSTNQTHPFSLTPPPETTLTSLLAGHAAQYSVYSTGQLTAAGGANLRSQYLRGHRPGWVPPLPLTATQYQTGSGQFSVGLSLQLRNSDRRAPLEVTVLQVVPWYVRLLLHTLRVTSASGAELQPVRRRLVPGRDRRRPHLLELAVSVPASSVATVHLQARRAFLKWHEYPPDANHGFYLPGAVVSALLPPANLTRHPHRSPPEQGGRVFVSLSTENLLVTLPTPDFSMPYNVICLVCTVVALAFGPLHNICTKQLVLEPISDKETGIVGRIRATVGRLKSCFRRDKQSTTDAPNTHPAKTTKAD